jgi:hypothetical protein
MALERGADTSHVVLNLTGWSVRSTETLFRDVFIAFECLLVARTVIA